MAETPPDPDELEDELSAELSEQLPEDQSRIFRRFSMDTDVAREIEDEELSAYRDNLLSAIDHVTSMANTERDTVGPGPLEYDTATSVPDRLLAVMTEYRDELDILTRERDEELIGSEQRYEDAEASEAAHSFVETFEGVEIDPEIEIGVQTGLPLRRERSLVVQEHDRVYEHMRNLGERLRQYASDRRKEEQDELEQTIETLETLQDDLETVSPDEAGSYTRLDAVRDDLQELVDDEALETIEDTDALYSRIQDRIETHLSRTETLLEKDRFDTVDEIRSLEEDLDETAPEPQLIDDDSYDDQTGPYLDTLVEYAVELAKQDIYHQTFPAPQQHVVFETDHIKDVLSLDPFEADTHLEAREAHDGEDEQTAFSIETYGLSAVEMDQLMFYRIRGTQHNEEKDGGLLSRWRSTLPIEQTDDGHTLSQDFEKELDGIRGYDASIANLKLNFLEQKDVENGHTINPERIDVYRVGPFFYQGMETPATIDELYEQHDTGSETELQEQAPKAYMEAGIAEYLNDNPDGFVFAVERETVDQDERFEDPDAYETPRTDSDLLYVTDSEELRSYLDESIETADETLSVTVSPLDDPTRFPDEVTER